MGRFSRGKKLEDRTMEILGRPIDQDFTVYPLGEGAASADEVRALGVRFGVALPGPVVVHLSGRFPGAILAFPLRRPQLHAARYQRGLDAARSGRARFPGRERAERRNRLVRERAG